MDDQRVHSPTFLDYDIARYDRIEDYANAVTLADARYQASLGAPGVLTAVNTKAVELRDRMLASTEPLVANGVLPAARIDLVRSGTGYRDTASDLMILAEVFDAVWSQIEGRTYVTRDDIDQARALSTQLVNALAQREQSDTAVAAAALTRRRAITALVRAYDEARRAVTYLRWHEGDADQLVPTLYARTPSPRRREDKAQPAEPTAATPSAPTAPSAPSAPSGPAVVPANIPQNSPFVPTK